MDSGFMERALAEARAAAELGEVPVGAVVVERQSGDVLAATGNRVEAERDPTGHAELLALRAAAKALGSPRLERCDLYVTLEPCPMCAGALVNGRVPRVVWGCNDPKAGATETLYTIGSDPRLNHRFECVPGVLGDECSALLTGFFEAIRAKNGPPKRR
jgi:tRNA(adenine34) deaminase